MSKHLGWISLFLVLLFINGCNQTSEATLILKNKGTLTVNVKVYCSGTTETVYATGTISPGESKTSTISWPGNDSVEISIISYPVSQSSRTKNDYVTLNNGDNQTVNLEFD